MKPLTPADAAVPEVLGVFGPTASGKSAVAETLADRLGTEVVSADALQVYRGIPILTNQPERPTRLVAIRQPSEEMSVGEYAALAHREIDELVDRAGTAIVAGGTGLYFRAALASLALPPAADRSAQRAIEELYDAEPGRAHERLASLDPAAAALVHPSDRRRVVRALELAERGASLVPARAELWSAEHRRSTLVVGLDVRPDVLAERIRARTASMLERGLLDEVRAASRLPLSRTADKALGLRELRDLPTPAALDALVARTLRYAAYQRKWMRRIPGIVMIEAERPPEEVADAILEVARRR